MSFQRKFCFYTYILSFLFGWIIIISTVIAKKQPEPPRIVINYESPTSAYNALRNKIMESERNSGLGGNVWLSSAEEKANSILMNAKREEIAEGIKDPRKYPPTMHFYQGRQYLRQSEVFRILQKMPKGALLHGHNLGMVSSKWIISNLTAFYNIYTCRNPNGAPFFTYNQNDTRCQSHLQNVCLQRVEAKDKRLFDKQLERLITMFNMHPESLLTDTKKIWNRFQNVTNTLAPILEYMPAYCSYHKRLLEELCEDNIQYAELRVSLTPLYGDNNKTYNSLEVANELERLSKEFRSKHPDFGGWKVIYTRSNKATVDEMAQRVNTFKELHQAKPNFIIGFDLDGQEDGGDALHKFANELTELPPTAHYFFHAGASNWYGQNDWNLMDALLLSSKRLGDGYALSRHPQMWPTVKKRNVAIEVTPVSNQVLGLLWDMRNHPAITLLAENFPVVIGADYPGLWNAKGLSFDFYYAFMALAPADADLRFLKQLALNSIRYSVLNGEERRQINRIFQKKWDQFIFNIINMRF